MNFASLVLHEQWEMIDALLRGENTLSVIAPLQNVIFDINSRFENCAHLGCLAVSYPAKKNGAISFADGGTSSQYPKYNGLGRNLRQDPSDQIEDAVSESSATLSFFW